MIKMLTLAWKMQVMKQKNDVALKYALKSINNGPFLRIDAVS